MESRCAIQIKVPATEESSYSIYIDASDWDNFEEFYFKKFKNFNVAVVSDDGIPPQQIKAFTEKLKAAGIPWEIVIFPAGDENKNIQTLNNIQNTLFEKNYGRDSMLIALGGGVVGDITGFCAGTFKRGIPYIQLPTTLLSQVDSSIGGKTALNNKFGKNQVGMFHNPSAVFINIATLKTLGRRHFHNGLAEVIKAAVIGDAELFEYIETRWEDILKQEAQCLLFIIRRSLEVKKKIIEADPYEKGLRRVLNFGHTIGHSLEQATGYRILHGEAVAIGMIAETELLFKKNLIRQDDCRRIKNLAVRLDALCYFKEGGKVEKKYFEKFLLQDKKRIKDRIIIINPGEIGGISVGKEKYAVEIELSDLLDILTDYL